MIVLYCIAIEYFQIDISANHWGHFELKLCPTNGKSQLATQECEFMMMMSLTKMMQPDYCFLAGFDKHPLVLAENPRSHQFYVPLDSPKVE